MSGRGHKQGLVIPPVVWEPPGKGGGDRGAEWAGVSSESFSPLKKSSSDAAGRLAEAQEG